MARFARAFVLASFVHLLLGGGLGVWMVHHPDQQWMIRWSHLHILVLGWVSMIIFGVSYHVLPRFAGTTLWSPAMAWWHFALALGGLWGMAVTGFIEVRAGYAPGSSPWGRWMRASADLQFAGMLLFVLNLLMSMRGVRPAPAAPPVPLPAAAGARPGPVLEIRPTTRVSEALAAHPRLLEVFRQFGFHALTNPILRETLARHVTIEDACKRHRVRVQDLIAALQASLSGKEPATGAAPPAAAAPAPCGCGVRTPALPSARATAPAGPRITAEMTTGECVGRFPATRAVFESAFGPGCFSCPAFGTEDLRTACLMHGTPLEEFLAACNRAAAPEGNAPAPRPAVRTRRISPEMSVREILQNHPAAGPVLQRFGIDSCCGGSHSLEEACRRHGTDMHRVLAEIETVLADPARSPGLGGLDKGTPGVS